MKNLKTITLALLATAAVSAQDVKTNQVPANLNNNFAQAYPNATNVEWEMEEMNYKVEFDLGKMDHEVWYSKTGSIVKTEFEILKTDVPAAVAATVQSKYPKYKIDEIEMTEENGKKTYEVELEKWFGKDKKLVIAEDGTFISERT
ncbi:PepSY-like domain-containing protein [Rasiella sp. SM2506]|uniref:PepSY-like domain-containing protein n=1 Tax=Rasiella sp. SM2506 TaxID=3423914 RepID=UPI003D79AD13